MKLNPQHIQELIKLINSSPYFQLLAMNIEDISLGHCRVKTDITTRHLSPYGAIQGGVYASLVDTAAYWAVYGELDEGVGLITLDVNVNHLNSVKSGELITIGEQIKSGSTLCLAQATVTDGNGKILAHGTSKLLVTRGLQEINQIAQVAGTILPPKFL